MLLKSEVMFKLSGEFVEQYAQRKPNFGYNGLGELVYMRTYSRLKESSEQERWYETVRRVVEGTYTMQKRWITEHHLGWSEQKAQRSAQEMYELMWSFKWLPPGRGLWVMGSSLTLERGLFAALNNCGFVSTKNIAKELSLPFGFLMDASMIGIGVGFDTRGGPAPMSPGIHYDTTGAGKLLVHPVSGDPETFVIPDSREGWVKSVTQQIDAYFTGGRPFTFDYSKIRPEGTPIKGFGGVASGPEPLRKLHENIDQVLSANAGSPITTTTIVDLMNLVGVCVVAGNVRRTAEIALGHPESEEFLDLKNYEVNPQRAAYGWTSNNSIFAELGMDYAPSAERVMRNGEPGYAWLHNMRAYSRMGDPADWKDKRVEGVNPCVEQSLESYELCCLAETFPANHDSFEEYQRTLKFAYLYAKTVTLGKTPWHRTNRVLLRNRRIGLSQSGIQQAVLKLGINEFKDWCENGYKAVRYYDDVYSEWFAIPRSIKVTSVKPSGTVSLLAGATPGLHWPEDKWYIRRMRLSKFSDLIPALLAAGYTLEPAVGSEDSTLVVEVPVEITEDLRTVANVSMWEQLAMAAFMQRHWADNQVSATISFDPITEGPHIAHALNYYQYQLKGVSFLPRLAEGAYPQMPYEGITEAEYKRRLAMLGTLEFGVSRDEAEQERFCGNDTCVI